MRYPEPEEEYITILDNRGRERIQHVEYLVTDVQGDTIYVTDDGLAYIHDALVRKGQEHLLELIERIPMILSNPQIVVADHLVQCYASFDSLETLIGDCQIPDFGQGFDNPWRAF